MVLIKKELLNFNCVTLLNILFKNLDNCWLLTVYLESEFVLLNNKCISILLMLEI